MRDVGAQGWHGNTWRLPNWEQAEAGCHELALARQLGPATCVRQRLEGRQ